MSKTAAQEPLVPFSLWGPTCDTIDFMKGPFLLPGKIREGDYIEIGNTGAYGRALAGRFNGYGAYDEAILLDEPMLSMYGAAEEGAGAAGPGVSRGPAGLPRFLPAEDSFLDPVRADAARPADARAVVIPFGLEASVSYGSGTAAGPGAIIAASQQLELYDEELGREAYLDYGVAAIAEPVIAKPLPAALEQLAGLVGGVLDAGKFPFVLGGEHSLTAGAIRPFAERYKDLIVLQFDAHADLRDGYLGEHYSHAAAMRRVLDLPGVSLVSVGIRAISKAEVEFYEANRQRISIHWAYNQAQMEYRAHRSRRWRGGRCT